MTHSPAPGRGRMVGLATALPPLKASVDEVWEALGPAPVGSCLRLPALAGRAGVDERARTLDYVRQYPDIAALVFAVELPSLTFQPNAHSVDNLIAAIVFGDGAGAAVVRAGDAPTGWTVEHCGTMLVPEGARHLGYELRDGGLRVVLSRELPQMVECHLLEAVESFLAVAGTTLAEIDLVAAHPGGPGIFDAIERALTLRADALAMSRQVFSEDGNASSAGIFFVLDAIEKARSSGRVLAIAFGPGLSIELALMRLTL